MRNDKTESLNRPALTNAGLSAALPAFAVDECGLRRDGKVACERPLTIYLDKREVVTLMTLGTNPELLTLGYLINQRLVPCVESIDSIQVDWETEAVVVTTFDGVSDLDRKLARRTVTTGCGTESTTTLWRRRADTWAGSSRSSSITSISFACGRTASRWP